METGRVPASPIELSARQLAWLKELGISKPWLPGASPKHSSSNAVPVANQAASKPSAVTVQTAPGFQTSAREVVQSVGQPVGQPLVQPVGQPPARTTVGAQSPAQVNDSSLIRGADAPAASLPPSDLQSLETQIRQCESCGLCRDRTHAVPGQGVMRPSIMVVGEAPGEQEDRQGLPFVGRSGQLLDNMLAAIAHHRDKNVYITNVVKCRPPGNRNPDAQEIAACASYLDRQIALIQPRAILAMGRFAAQTLMKKEASMQALRGQVHVVDVQDRQIPIVATYHPAYLLRRPVEKASAWQDLNRIASLV